MQKTKIRGTHTIVLSFIIAMLLMALPLPAWAIDWRPNWLLLIFSYWCMALPQRIGIAIGWTMGLLLDVQQASPLGFNALQLVLLSYILLRFHRQIRVFPLAQQSLLLGIFLITYNFIALWILRFVGIEDSVYIYGWPPTLVSVLLWPLVFITLRGIRHRYVSW